MRSLLQLLPNWSLESSQKQYTNEWAVGSVPIKLYLYSFEFRIVSMGHEMFFWYVFNPLKSVKATSRLWPEPQLPSLCRRPSMVNKVSGEVVYK